MLRYGHIHLEWDWLVNNQEHIVLVFAKDVLPFLPNASVEHLLEIRQLRIGNLSTVTLHSMPRFALFWFVKRYNFPAPRDIMLFMVVNMSCPDSIFAK